jgi:hypothetical protein
MLDKDTILALWLAEKEEPSTAIGQNIDLKVLFHGLDKYSIDLVVYCKLTNYYGIK